MSTKQTTQSTKKTTQPEKESVKQSDKKVSETEAIPVEDGETETIENVTTNSVEESDQPLVVEEKTEEKVPKKESKPSDKYDAIRELLIKNNYYNHFVIATNLKTDNEWDLSDANIDKFVAEFIAGNYLASQDDYTLVSLYNKLKK